MTGAAKLRVLLRVIGLKMPMQMRALLCSLLLLLPFSVGPISGIAWAGKGMGGGRGRKGEPIQTKVLSPKANKES